MVSFKTDNCKGCGLYAELEGKIADLFPMDLQKRPV